MDQLQGWCLEAFPSMADRLPALVEACLDWHQAEGKRRKDWTAALRSWIRKEAQMEQQRRGAGGRR
jgi:hypothetical protein